MHSRTLPKWLEFEHLIARIQKQLAPTATITHAERVKGKSGEVRKIDVTIRQDIGSYPMLVVIDCKRRSRPVPVGYVEAFCGQVEDVGANLGVLVSTRGFTKGALAVAARRGILTQTFRDAEKSDWDALIGPQAWTALFKVFLGVKSVNGKATDGANVPLGLDSLVANGPGGESVLLADLFWQVWNQSPLPRPLGSVRVGIVLNPGPMLVLIGGTLVTLKDLEVIGDVWVKKWPVNLHMASGRVLTDSDGNPVFGEFESTGFDWAEIMRTHPSIDLSEAEYAELSSTSRLSADLSKADRFLRVSMTRTTKDNS